MNAADQYNRVKCDGISKGGVHVAHPITHCMASARRAQFRFIGRGAGAGRRSGEGRPELGAHRRRRRKRQADPDGAGVLARRCQRQGRAARATCAARLLRRQEQSLGGAGDLHQAARRRQGRPSARAIRHQHGRAGDAGHHAEQQDHDQLPGDRHQPALQLSEILFHGPGWAEGAGRVLGRFLRAGGSTVTEAADRGHRLRRCRVRQDHRRCRAGQRQSSRLQRGVRALLPTADNRFPAGRARRAGGKRRYRICRRLPARQRRHHPRGK